jgi:glutathione S-transferase
MRGEPYRLEPTLAATGAPRGKLPWIEDHDVVLGDSSAIVRHLERGGDVLDEHGVTPEVRSRAHLVRRVVEESLYFALLCDRWRDPALRARYTDDLLAALPPEVRPEVVRSASALLEDQLWKQGSGRLELDVVRAVAADDLAAIAAILGQAPYLTGDRARAADASLFGWLDIVWHVPVSHPLRVAVARHPNLVAYIERMRERFAADVPAITPA